MRAMKTAFHCWRKPSFRIYAVLLAVLSLAIGLRVWGLDFGLPYLYHPDEPYSLSITTRMVKTQDWNPHFFRYPSFYFYMHALTYYPFYWIQKLRGIHASIQDLAEAIVLVPGAGIMHKPALLYRGRLLSAFSGVMAVLLAYFCGKKMSGKPLVGLFAALFLAVSPANVNNSHLMTPDSPIVMFAFFSLLGAIDVYQSGRTRSYLLAGVAAALSASSKYNGGFIFIALVAAHFLRYGWRGVRDANLYLGAVATGVTFFLVNPYFILDFNAFWSDFTAGVKVYSTGHPGEEGDQLIWYLQYLATTEGFIPFLGLLGILWAIIRRDKDALVVTVFPAFYFILILFFKIRNERTILPMLGMNHILAAQFCVFLFERLRTNLSKPVWLGLVGVSTVCLLATPLYQSVQINLRYTQVDSRETARVWIEENIPWDSRIVLERYAPYLQKKMYQILTVESMADHPPEWYIAQRVNYLVFSEGIFRRYETNPNLYPDKAQAYEALFKRFKLIKVFDDGGYEIRIYEVIPKGP